MNLNQNWKNVLVFSKPRHFMQLDFLSDKQFRVCVYVMRLLDSPNNFFIFKIESAHAQANGELWTPHESIFETINIRNWYVRCDWCFATCKNMLHNSHFAILFSITILSNGKHNNLHWKIVDQLQQHALHNQHIYRFLWVIYLCHGLFSIDLRYDAEKAQRKPWLSRTFDIWSVSTGVKFLFSRSSTCSITL